VTEQEWLTCSDPKPMLEFLCGQTTERKLRFFAVACCRHIWNLLIDPGSRKAVIEAELHADGRLTDEQLCRVSEEAEAAFQRVRAQQPDPVSDSPQKMAASAVWGATVSRLEDSIFVPDEPIIGMAINTALQAEVTAEYEWQDEQRTIQSSLVRDIFGNPFCPANADPTWHTLDVISLATGIYEDRAFDRLPILADALQDAGCDNDDILDHCRSDGPHVRGCWVVDLLLGKS
jgi:hypothetical protein